MMAKSLGRVLLVLKQKTSRREGLKDPGPRCHSLAASARQLLCELAVGSLCGILVVIQSARTHWRESVSYNDGRAC